MPDARTSRRLTDLALSEVALDDAPELLEALMDDPDARRELAATRELIAQIQAALADHVESEPAAPSRLIELAVHAEAGRGRFASAAALISRWWVLGVLAAVLLTFVTALLNIAQHRAALASRPVVGGHSLTFNRTLHSPGQDWPWLAGPVQGTAAGTELDSLAALATIRQWSAQPSASGVQLAESGPAWVPPPSPTLPPAAILAPSRDAAERHTDLVDDHASPWNPVRVHPRVAANVPDPAIAAGDSDAARLAGLQQLHADVWPPEGLRLGGTAGVDVVTEHAPHPQHPGRHLVRVSVRGQPLAPAHRDPINLVVVVDLEDAGPGPDDRLTLRQVTEGLRELFAQLGPNDRLSLIHVRDPQPTRLEHVPGDPRAWQPALRAMAQRDLVKAVPGYDQWAAIDTALSLARPRVAGVEGAGHVLWICEAAPVARSREQIENLIQYSNRATRLGVVQLGTGPPAHYLVDLARTRSGEALRAMSSADIASSLMRQLGWPHTRALHLAVSVGFDPMLVSRYRQIGRDQPAVNVVPRLVPGQQVHLLYEVEIQPDANLALTLGTASLQWKSPDTVGVSDWAQGIEQAPGGPSGFLSLTMAR